VLTPIRYPVIQTYWKTVISTVSVVSVSTLDVNHYYTATNTKTATVSPEIPVLYFWIAMLTA
jgi:hypothetical protein